MASDNELIDDNNDENVHSLEIKLNTLETEVFDLKYRVIENERRAKEEKQRKRGNKFYI